MGQIHANQTIYSEFNNIFDAFSLEISTQKSKRKHWNRVKSLLRMQCINHKCVFSIGFQLWLHCHFNVCMWFLDFFSFHFMASIWILYSIQINISRMSMKKKRKKTDRMQNFPEIPTEGFSAVSKFAYKYFIFYAWLHQNANKMKPQRIFSLKLSKSFQDFLWILTTMPWLLNVLMCRRENPKCNVNICLDVNSKKMLNHIDCRNEIIFYREKKCCIRRKILVAFNNCSIISFLFIRRHNLISILRKSKFNGNVWFRLGRITVACQPRITSNFHVNIFQLISERLPPRHIYNPRRHIYNVVYDITIWICVKSFIFLGLWMKFLATHVSNFA